MKMRPDKIDQVVEEAYAVFPDLGKKERRGYVAALENVLESDLRWIPSSNGKQPRDLQRLESAVEDLKERTENGDFPYNPESQAEVKRFVSREVFGEPVSPYDV